MTTITIGEETTVVDVVEELTDTPIELVPSRIGYFGELLGEAEKEKITCDAMYRKWRAEQGNEFRRRDRNLPEWRVKQKTEAQDAFYSYKLAQASCERNVTVLRNLIAGLSARVGIQDPNPGKHKEDS